MAAAQKIGRWFHSLLGRTQKLPTNDEIFSIYLDGIKDGMFDWDLQNNTMRYPASYQILGYTEKEMGTMHSDWQKFVHPDDHKPAVELALRYAKREIPQYKNTFRMRHKDGRWIWLQSRAVGVWNKKGEMQRLVGMHVDITQQKEHEESLKKLAEENKRQREELEVAIQRAEAASRAKSDFLATMSHEIRTPLNVVIGVAQLLRKKNTSGREAAMVDALYANADHLSKLVNDLLDLSRIEATDIELAYQPFVLSNILDVVRNMFEGEMSSKGITLLVHDRADTCVLMGDALRLQQILINLMGNALKFTEQGQVTVAAECEIKNDQAFVTIMISDTGVGILPEKIDTIFDKFVQGDQSISRRYGGSGLGLAICKSLATLMGGDISVASKPDEGSTFTLTLPFKIGQSEGVAEPHNTLATDSICRGVALLVEDYPPNVMVAKYMLEELGYDVDVAASGTEALDKIRSRLEAYDVILMDVHMPDMDGFEVTKKVRELEQQKGFRHYIVGLTAHALIGDRERCIKAGMDEYVTKPINPAVFVEKLSARVRAA